VPWRKLLGEKHPAQAAAYDNRGGLDAVKQFGVWHRKAKLRPGWAPQDWVATDDANTIMTQLLEASAPPALCKSTGPTNHRWTGPAFSWCWEAAPDIKVEVGMSSKTQRMVRIPLTDFLWYCETEALSDHSPMRVLDEEVVVKDAPDLFDLLSPYFSLDGEADRKLMICPRGAGITPSAPAMINDTEAVQYLLLEGHVRWFVFPPGAHSRIRRLKLPPSQVQGPADWLGVRDGGLVQVWSEWPSVSQPIQLNQLAGEVVTVPAGWFPLAIALQTSTTIVEASTSDAPDMNPLTSAPKVPVKMPRQSRMPAQVRAYIWNSHNASTVDVRLQA